VGGPGGDARLLHGIEDAPVDGLEAVTGVRQGAPRDDRHRVVDVRLLHLLFDSGRLDFGGERLVAHVGCVRAHISTHSASPACSLMNCFRGPTASPIRMENILSAAAASSTVIRFRILFSGFIVVSQS